MLAIVAPGQGAQTPGFLSPWLVEPTFATRLGWLSTVANLDLVHYGTEADAESIRDTAIAQPLLVAAGLLTAVELFPSPADGFRRTGVAAGHSVGEITAAGATGVLTAEQAMVFVRERGKAMAEASALEPTGMSAVVGGEAEEVLALLATLGLTPANNNGKGQIVAAGSLTLLRKLADNPPAKARVMPLSVAGAFHTEYMASARAELEALVEGLSPADPSRLLLSNADGAAVTSGREVLSRLVSQVTSPVRFDACLGTMRDLGVTALLELPPAGALAGLAKREWKGSDIEVLALAGPADLDRARELISAERSRSEAEHLPDWRVVVSPVRGTVSPAGISEGTRLPAGTPLGRISSRRQEADVSAGYDGVLAEWLVADGDLVDAGDPIARLYPEVQS